MDKFEYMTSWQYNIITRDGKLTKITEELGKQGWEITILIKETQQIILKRKLTQTQD